MRRSLGMALGLGTLALGVLALGPLARAEEKDKQETKAKVIVRAGGGGGYLGVALGDNVERMKCCSDAAAGSRPAFAWFICG